jgi:predicted CXXCH cytochrome family protein
MGPWTGSAACSDCHVEIFEAHQSSGHAQHVQRIESESPPTYFWQDQIENPLPGPPPNLSWADVALVVGGTTGVTVFVDHEGNLVTGPDTRWHHASARWAAFFPGETVEFGCTCHVTGEGEEAGTWNEPGVGCEACHGAGRTHTQSESAGDIIVNRSNDLCYGCHSVVENHPYPGTSTTVPDWSHQGALCVACHDPHPSSRFDPAAGIFLDCPDCHESSRTAASAHARE